MISKTTRSCSLLIFGIILDLSAMTQLTLKPLDSKSIDNAKKSCDGQIETKPLEGNKIDRSLSDQTAEEQFERVLHDDRQQNLRVSQRYDPGCRYSDPGGKDPVSDNQLVNSPMSNHGCIWIAKDRMRFIVIFLGLVAIVLNQMSRVVVNITIPLMTYPVNSSSHTSQDSCPLPSFEPNSTSPISPSSDTNHGLKKYDWSPADQDRLLGAFFYTYSLFQIPGGVLAERYGAKYILCASVTVSGLANLLTPWLADQEMGLTLLFWTRILVGIVQASVLPAVYALIAQWNTATEGIVIASILKMAFRLGALLGSIVPGLVVGWEPAYYITGILCMIWTVLWLFLSTSKPQDNSCVSYNELYRIARKKNDRNFILASVENNDRTKPKFIGDGTQASDCDSSTKTKPIGWRVWVIILTSRSVIGFVLCKLSVNFTTDFLTSIMPTFIRDLYHGNKSQVVISFPISWLVKYTERSRPFGLKATGMRRVFTSFLCFGSSIFLALLTLVRCDLIYATVILQFLAMINMLGGGGEALIPYDLTDEYPATIAAIGNSISSMSGFVIPALKTAIIGKETDSVSAWNYYILAIALLQAIGGFIFIFNVKAKKLDFTVKPSETNEPCDDQQKVGKSKLDISKQASEPPTAANSAPMRSNQV